MPLLLKLSLLPWCALAFSFFTTASTFSLTNEFNLINPRKPNCYPASGDIPPLTERDCQQALGEFQRNLPFFEYPILTRDPDKAHLPQYILAPVTATWRECMFRADIPQGNDAPIDVQALVYQANVLMAKCVTQAYSDGGRCSVEAEGSTVWIKIDFRHLTPLTNVTNVGVGNITNAAGLVLNFSTAENPPSLPAISGNAVAESR